MLLGMYLTMSPLIAGGILNMIFTKTPIYKKYKYPIDGYKNYKDNKRIFGDNKTWIGFFSMIFFCIISQIICGFLCNNFNINHLNDLYMVNHNTITFNILFGALIGFVYMLSELPNSFVKRRLNIKPGKTESGTLGLVFFIIDQIDSLVGVMFVLYLFSNISIMKYFGYILVGAFTHVGINSILYMLKIRKNI